MLTAEERTFDLDNGYFYFTINSRACFCDESTFWLWNRHAGIEMLDAYAHSRLAGWVFENSNCTTLFRLKLHISKVSANLNISTNDLATSLFEVKNRRKNRNSISRFYVLACSGNPACDGVHDQLWRLVFRLYSLGNVHARPDSVWQLPLLEWHSNFDWSRTSASATGKHESTRKGFLWSLSFL